MASTWTVDFQEVKPTIDRANRFVDEVTIHYTITSGPAAGHSDYITVSRAEYADLDLVKSRIDTQVAQASNIAGL